MSTEEDTALCPFDSNHRVPVKRFQYHLAACRMKHPKKAKKMASCKFNACHIVLRENLEEHEATCANRSAIDDEPFDFPEMASPPLEPQHTLPNAANQIPECDVWNIDNTQPYPVFVLKTFGTKSLGNDSDQKDRKRETADGKHS